VPWSSWESPAGEDRSRGTCTAVDAITKQLLIGMCRDLVRATVDCESVGVT
jgi:hypothetical protein